MAFETLHEETYAALVKDPYLAKCRVEILLEDKGDILNAIKMALGKLGICAVVSMPSARAQSENSRNITAMADITVQVLESPVMNRNRANMCSAGTAARRIATALNLNRLPSGETPVFQEISGGALDKDTLMFSVQFKALTNL
jgi:hypothetical protein